MRKSTRRARGATSGILDTLMAAGDPQGLGLEFLAALVSSTADGILVLDSDCRIVCANPVACDWLGYPLDRLLGRDRLAFMPKHERPTYRALLDKALHGGSSELSPVIIQRPDGSELEIEAKATVLDLQGKYFFLLAGRDATERRRRGRQAAGLAQAAVGLAASGSIEAFLTAICQCALAGTCACSMGDAR